VRDRDVNRRPRLYTMSALPPSAKIEFALVRSSPKTNSAPDCATAEKGAADPAQGQRCIGGHVSGKGSKPDASRQSCGNLARIFEPTDIVVWAQNRAARVLGIGASVAAAKMLELIHSSSQRVGFEASRHVLALAGLKPTLDNKCPRAWGSN
jgi:hypothetical protein